MTQEVQVILTLEVNVEESKEDIISELYFKLPNLIKVDSIKEEKEIYNNE